MALIPVVVFIALCRRVACKTLQEAEPLGAAAWLALATEGGTEDSSCSAGGDRCDSLSLRQLRGELVEVGVHERAEPESVDCKIVAEYCSDFMTYGEKSDCTSDDACHVLDVGEYGGEPGTAWFCAPSDADCEVDATPEQFQPVDELPEESEPEGNETLHAWQGSTPGTCRGRSCWSYMRYPSCQCNSKCSRYGNCCADYGSVCQSGGQSGGAAAIEGPVKTLYHTTSRRAAGAILATGFRPGRSGWCGGAIYFVDTPYLKRSKYAPGITKAGAIIEAQVTMGTMATHFDRHCRGYGGGGVRAARHAGYNSILFNPGDGNEFIIWDPRQVQSTRLYKYM